MRIGGISRVDAVELPVPRKERAPATVDGLSTRGDMAENAAQKSSAQPVLQLTGEQQAQLLIGSRVHVTDAGGPLDKYAKIRYDENARTVLIQIINAASGEVIREIPPDAWVKLRENMPLPKGTVVEKEG